MTIRPSVPAPLPSITFTAAPRQADVAAVAVTTVADEPALAGPLAGDALAQGTPIGQIVTGTAPDDIAIVPGTCDVAPLVALVGIDGPRATTENLRRAAGTFTRRSRSESVILALPVADLAEAIAVAEGALFGAYRFTAYRGATAATSPAAVRDVQVVVPAELVAAATAATPRLVATAEAVWGVRALVNTAPNDLYPEAFVAAVKDTVKAGGRELGSVKVTVIDDKALAADPTLGGLIAVGQGSARPPRLVKLTYKASNATGPHIGLIGKGITFDTGGISLKPAANMDHMKSDMAGAATVFQTVIAAARIGLPVQVTAYLALAENMPSGSASRPSDVIVIGGTSVEILNTDAEGRLVMADALTAARADGAEVLVDIATLTGAQIVALGDQVAAVMGTDDTREGVVAAASSTGELAWPMPLPPELRASLNSKVADISNLGDRAGGMLSAGLFLREFTGGLPWAHIDIAGPSFNTHPAHDYTPEGGTGFGVRTLLAFLEAASE